MSDWKLDQHWKKKKRRKFFFVPDGFQNGTGEDKWSKF